MKNSTKAFAFLASLMLGIGALSMAYAPVEAKVTAPVVIDVPKMVVTGVVEPKSNAVTIPEVTVTGRRVKPAKPAKPATKVATVAKGETVGLHILRQGGRPNGDFVIVRD